MKHSDFRLKIAVGLVIGWLDTTAVGWVLLNMNVKVKRYPLLFQTV